MIICQSIISHYISWGMFTLKFSKKILLFFNLKIYNVALKVSGKIIREKLSGFIRKLEWRGKELQPFTSLNSPFFPYLPTFPLHFPTIPHLLQLPYLPFSFPTFPTPTFPPSLYIFFPPYVYSSLPLLLGLWFLSPSQGEGRILYTPDAISN